VVEEIRELAVRYCHALDRADAAALGAMFTADAVFTPRRGEPPAGRESVVSYLCESVAARPGSLHLVLDQTIEAGDEGFAQGTVRMMAILAGEGRSESLLLGYDDRYRVEDGRWRFAARTVHPLAANRDGLWSLAAEAGRAAQ
jgi:uncharacterized protein (TIGR02246 family)